MRIAGAALMAAGLLVACGGGDERARAADEGAGDTTAAAADTAARRLATVEAGLQGPESAIYDADQNVWFVTNVNGGPGAKDNNGFITRLRSDGTVDSLKFVAAGERGVTLHAPKGQAIVGDTLWVADIDAVRGFDKRTGAAVATVNFGDQAGFLNDITTGPDGTLYVTDTGVRSDEQGASPGKIFAVSSTRQISVVAEGDDLQGPNGITWDAANERLVVVPFAGTTLFGLTPGSAPDSIGSGPGQQDGVEVLADGRMLVSSWTDSTLFIADAGDRRTVVTGVPSPADIGVNAATNQVAVPMLMENRVEIWQLPS